jgi:hypothetical protein
MSDTPRTKAAWAKCFPIMDEGKFKGFEAVPLYELCASFELQLQSKHAICRDDAKDAERFRWMVANGLQVARDVDGDWTCWLAFPCIPCRSQTEDPRVLLDALVQRFPEQPQAVTTHNACLAQEKP